MEGTDTRLPTSDADELAATLPEPTSAPTTNLSSSAFAPKRPAPTPTTQTLGAVDGLENEDIELQRALQASMQGVDYHSHIATSGAGASSSPVQPARSEESIRHEESVKASMARGQALLARARAEQEAALQDGFEELITGPSAPALSIRDAVREAGSRARIPPRVDSGSGGPATRSNTAGSRTQVTRGEDDEEEMIRIAIEESLRSSGGRVPSKPVAVDEDEDDDDDDVRLVRLFW